MQNLVRSFAVLALAISLLIASYSSARTRTCEEVFEGARKGSILSPETVPQRVIKSSVVRRLFGRSNAVRGGSTASYDNYAVSRGVRDVSPLAPQATAIEGMSFRVSPKNPVTSIRWLSEESLILNEAFSVHGNEAILISTTLEQTVKVVLDSMKMDMFKLGQLLARFQSVEKIAMYNVGDSSFLIAQEPSAGDPDETTYRFIDKKTLADVRETIVSTSIVRAYGNFLTFTHLGRNYLTSIHPSDFGAFWRRRVEREMPAGFQLRKVLKDGAALEGVVDGFPQSMYFDGARYLKSKTVHEQELRDYQGETYVIYDDSSGDGSRVLRRKSDSKVQIVKLSAFRTGPAGAKLPILAIFGEGPSRTLLMQGKFESARFLLRIGDQDITPVRMGEAFDNVEELGARFLLSRPSGGGFELTRLIDKATAQIHILSRQHGPKTDPKGTTLLDNESFVTIDKYYPDAPDLVGRPKSSLLDISDYDQNVIFVRDIHGHKVREMRQADRSLVKIYDLESKQFVRSVELQGDARLISGTRIARVEKGMTVEFFDLLSESVLWSGPTSFFPRLSPDGSRVAFLRDDVVYVKVLGERPESRRTY